MCCDTGSCSSATRSLIKTHRDRHQPAQTQALPCANAVPQQGHFGAGDAGRGRGERPVTELKCRQVIRRRCWARQLIT